MKNKFFTLTELREKKRENEKERKRDETR